MAADSPALVAEREALIADSERTGLIVSVNWEHPTMVVGESFYRLDYAGKKAIAQTVVSAGMARRGRADFDLALVDRKTGKTVGGFSSIAWSFSMY